MVLLELAEEVGLTTKRVASTNGGEYSSPCPECGGDDRFRLWPKQKATNCIGRYWCRRCDISGDAIQFCRRFLGLDFKAALKRSHATMPKQSLFPVREKRKVFNVVEAPPKAWQERVRDFIDYSHSQIFSFPGVVSSLEKRGLAKEAVEQYRIGYYENPDCQYERFEPYFSELGLEEKLYPNGKRRHVWIPKGIVIPTIEASGIAVRLKIRRSEWKPDDKLPKYIAIPGSMQGMNIIGNTKKDVMIVVESELDAYTVHFSLRDCAFVVAVGSNTKNPDNVTNYLANKAKLILICHDNDDGGKTMLHKWHRLYSNTASYPVPYGKDIGEAVQKGLNLREWLLKGIQST